METKVRKNPVRSFTDSKGLEWEVNFNLTTARPVWKTLGINLFNIADDRFALMAKLSTDFCLLVDALYLICKAQADAREITEEQFGESMAGDSIEAGFDALMESICDALPGEDRRAAMRNVYHAARDASREIQQKGAAAVTQALSGMTTADIIKAGNDAERLTRQAIAEVAGPVLNPAAAAMAIGKTIRNPAIIQGAVSETLSDIGTVPTAPEIAQRISEQVV